MYTYGMYTYGMHTYGMRTYGMYTLDFYGNDKFSGMMHFQYIILKDSSADLGVNFKIVQIRPTVKAICTKISKKFFCIFVNILMFLRENKEA